MRRSLLLLITALLAVTVHAQPLEDRAESGDPEAQHRLGEYYLRKMPPDYGNAVTWLNRAALQGYTDAQYQLGRLYGADSGNMRDPVKAYAWYRLAARSERRAGAAVNLLATEMDEQQIQQGEAEAARLRERVRAGGPPPLPPPPVETVITDPQTGSSQASLTQNTPTQNTPTRGSPPVATTGGNYWLQLGTFANRANVERLAAQLRKEGVTPILESRPIEDGVLTRLGAGPFADLADAHAAAERYRNRYGLHGLVKEGLPKAAASPPPSGGKANAPSQTPTTQPPVATTPAAQRVGYLIQLGTFADAANAERVAVQLRAQGASPILEPLASGDRTLTRLRVGPYAELERARAARDELSDRFSLKGWIVPIQ